MAHQIPREVRGEVGGWVGGWLTLASPPISPTTHPFPTHSTSFEPPRSPLPTHPPTHQLTSLPRAGESEEMGQAGHLRLRDITLSRIPHLRSFVNDALLDVLYFMSPAYHQVRLPPTHPLSMSPAYHQVPNPPTRPPTPSVQHLIPNACSSSTFLTILTHPPTHPPIQVILDEVAAEMNRIVTLYRQHTRNFSGKVSVAAHSLGGTSHPPTHPPTHLPTDSSTSFQPSRSPPPSYHPPTHPPRRHPLRSPRQPRIRRGLRRSQSQTIHRP